MCCWYTAVRDAKYRLPGVQNAKTWNHRLNGCWGGAWIQCRKCVGPRWDLCGPELSLGSLFRQRDCFGASTVDFTCTISLQWQTCVTTTAFLYLSLTLWKYFLDLSGLLVHFHLCSTELQMEMREGNQGLYFFLKRGTTFRMWGILESLWHVTHGYKSSIRPVVEAERFKCNRTPVFAVQ